jgi:ABC-type dipeptide/oligopeptide/nickel transport system permease subunit
LFLILVGTTAALAPWIAPYSYEEQLIAERLNGPSLQHLFGTDSLGRDVLSRIIYGARISLGISVLSALAAVALGTIVGAVSGFFLGWIDRLSMRIVDFFLIFPSMLTAILMTLYLGRGFRGICLALIVTTWAAQARLIRGQVLLARESLYVESARALGASHFSIIFRHILPNLRGPLGVALTLQVPANILSESFLSFLGLGFQPPHASWGTLAAEGFQAFTSYPHLVFFPGIVLFLTMLAFQQLGDRNDEGSSVSTFH